MGISRMYRRNALWTGLLLAALLVGGCAGIEPYEPRDHREEGPEMGLVSGSDGEFVIYRKADAPDTGGEADQKPDETADGEQQKLSGKKKKTGIKSGEQYP